MKVGIIGAGRVGCSMGKYLTDKGKTVTGYYSKNEESAAKAAEFTGTDCFRTMEELVALSDTLFITTPDEQIGVVWGHMKAMSVDERVICHFSGSLSSDVFIGIEEKNAFGISIHPLLAFRDKVSAYKQLKHCFFTLEGNPYAVKQMEGLLTELGNPYCKIKAEDKAKYHCAASILSNDVLALLDLGFGLLEQCGFTKEEARTSAAALVRGNIENILENGTLASMTGPILRGDVSTVEKHLQVLCGDTKEIYRLLGKHLAELAEKKQPENDYRKMRSLLQQGTEADKKQGKNVEKGNVKG